MKILMKSIILQSAAWLMVLVDIPTAAGAGITGKIGPTLTDVRNELMDYINTTLCHRPGSFRVGTSCYYIVLERMTWQQAKARCQSLSMELAHPPDTISGELRDYIEARFQSLSSELAHPPDTISGELRDYIAQHHAKSVIGHNFGAWVGARGNSNTQLWVSDGSPVKSDLMWPGNEAKVDSSDCLALKVAQDYVDTRPPYSVMGCSENVRVLCQGQYHEHDLCSRLPTWDCSNYKIQCPNHCS